MSSSCRQYSGLQQLAPYLLKISVLIGVAYIVYDYIDINLVYRHIANTNLGFLVITMLIILLVPVGLGMRLAYIADIRLKVAIDCTFKAVFFNNFLPAQFGGDAYKIIKLSRNDMDKKSSVAAVASDRIIGLITHILLLVVSVVFGWQYFSNNEVRYGIVLYVIAFTLILALIYLVPENLIQKMTRFHTSLISVGQMIKQTHRLLKVSILTKMMYGVLLSALSIGVSMIVVLCAMYALHLNPHYAAILVFHPVIAMLVLTVPISFNGLGVREGLFVYFYQMVGYTSEEAFAISVIYLLATICMSLAGGALLLVGREKLTKINSE